MAERTNLRFPADFEWIIYVRISDDREGAGLGVARQEVECRQVADRLGGTVLVVLVDNDLTANDRSGRYKPRPDYEKLPPLLEAKPGSRGVISWHTDRLHRTPRELEDFIDLIETTGAAVETAKAGSIDLSTASGRMTARVHCAVARHESEHKSERIRSKVLELATAGKIGNGGPRPFGFTRVYAGDGPRRKIVRDEICEPEAELVREWAGRLLAGESKRSIALDARKRGILTSTGKPWSIQSLHYLMRSGRIAGLREHNREVIGSAEWPAIIDGDTHKQLRALLDQGKGTQGPNPRKHYMSGVVFCPPPCETVMRVGSVRGQLRYQCPPDTGCNGRAIQHQPLVDLIDKYMIGRLSDPDLLRDLGAYEQDVEGETRILVDKIEAEERRLTALQGQLDEDDPEDLPEVVAAIRKTRTRIRDTRARLAGQAGVPHGLADPADLANRWTKDLPLERKHSLLKLFVEKIYIGPAVRGRGYFDPSRVDVVPRRWDVRPQ